MSHYKPYSAYKGSGVEWLGDVPEGWSTKPLWAVTTVNDDERDVFTDGLLEIEYVDISTVTLEGGIARPNWLLAKDAPSRAQRKAKSGDVVISTVRTYLRAIGKVLPTHESAIFSTGFAIVRAANGFVPEFLYYALLSEHFLSNVEARSTGVSYPAINASDIVKIKAPIPSMQEQHIIAAHLDRETTRIDGLVSKKTRFIELLREKRRALITHAVTKGLDPNVKMKDSGVEWLGNVAEHWGVKLIKYVKAETNNAFVDGPFGSNLKSEHFVDGGDVYVIESNFATQGRLIPAELKTITAEHFQTICRSEASEGDIIIAKIGAQFGKAAILPKLDKRSVVSGNSLKLTLNEKICLRDWAFWQLINLKNNGAIDDLAKGGAQPALSLGEMNDLPILTPSLLEQQEVIAHIERETTRFDRLVSQTKRSIELLKERRSALIAAAVTGQIDLRAAA